MRKISAALNRLFRPNRFSGPFSWDDETLSMEVDGKRVTLRWDEVTAAYAYIRDCFTTDQYRVEFVGENDSLIATEETCSLELLQQAMSQHLQIPATWLGKLAYSKPFDPTIHKLYPL
jgi:hypothetical protein